MPGRTGRQKRREVLRPAGVKTQRSGDRFAAGSPAGTESNLTYREPEHMNATKASGKITDGSRLG